jgi:hypothetical protein
VSSSEHVLETFKLLEYRQDVAIHHAAGLAWPPEHHETVAQVKHWDLVMFVTEWRDLMRGVDHPNWAPYENITPLPDKIMADKSAIEWTDATWNPVVGCSIVSPGCTNCYAMKMAARIEKMASSPMAAHVNVQTHYAGTTQRSKAGAVWTGKVARAPEHILTQPLKWKRPRKIFVNSMGDLFHESIPDEWIDRVFAVMALAPQHTFQVLTKRAERMRSYLRGRSRLAVGNGRSRARLSAIASKPLDGITWQPPQRLARRLLRAPRGSGRADRASACHACGRSLRECGAAARSNRLRRGH